MVIALFPLARPRDFRSWGHTSQTPVIPAKAGIQRELSPFTILR